MMCLLHVLLFYIEKEIQMKTLQNNATCPSNNATTLPHSAQQTSSQSCSNNGEKEKGENHEFDIDIELDFENPDNMDYNLYLKKRKHHLPSKKSSESSSLPTESNETSASTASTTTTSLPNKNESDNKPDAADGYDDMPPLIDMETGVIIHHHVSTSTTNLEAIIVDASSQEKGMIHPSSEDGIVNHESSSLPLPLPLKRDDYRHKINLAEEEDLLKIYEERFITIDHYISKLLTKINDLEEEMYQLKMLIFEEDKDFMNTLLNCAENTGNTNTNTNPYILKMNKNIYPFDDEIHGNTEEEEEPYGGGGGGGLSTTTMENELGGEEEEAYPSSSHRNLLNIA